MTFTKTLGTVLLTVLIFFLAGLGLASVEVLFGTGFVVCTVILLIICVSIILDKS